MLVGRSSRSLVVGNFRLEVVVVGFLGQRRKHLNPFRLLNEKRIDRLALLAVPLAGADGAEEAVFGEYPHGGRLVPLPLDLGNLRHKVCA